jgi:hypothetical protein
MLNVAIAVDSPTDYGPQAVQVVASACEEVIGEHRCPVASDLEPGAVAAWYAVVHPNDRALSSVRIEFRDRTADGVLIEQRSLTFSARDSQESRLASVGSVIAALAAAREGALTRPSQALDAPPPSAPPAAPAPAPESSPPDGSVDVAALVTPGFGDAPYRLGGFARGHVGFSDRPFALAAVRYEAHPGNPEFSWWTLSAGVGTRIAGRAAIFNLEFSAEVVFEHTSIAADRGADRDSAGQDGWGGRVGVGAVWATCRHCSVILGIDATWVLPRINVIVGGQDATRVPPASVGFLLGVRFLP